MVEYYYNIYYYTVSEWFLGVPGREPGCGWLV